MIITDRTDLGNYSPMRRNTRKQGNTSFQQKIVFFRCKERDTHTQREINEKGSKEEGADVNFFFKEQKECIRRLKKVE